MKKRILFIGACMGSNIIGLLVIMWLTGQVVTTTNIYEKFLLYLRQIVVLLGIVGLTLVITKIVFSKSKLEATRLHEITYKEGNEKFNLKTFLKFIANFLISVGVRGPIIEELIFRLPLLLLFSELNSVAWIAIAYSTLVFAVMHFPDMPGVIKAKNQESDLNLTLKENAKNNVKPIVIEYILKFIFTFGMGVLVASLVIKKQSLWVAVIIHGAWNIGAVVLIPILVTIIAVLVLSIVSLFSWVRYKLS